MKSWNCSQIAQGNEWKEEWKTFVQNETKDIHLLYSNKYYHVTFFLAVLGEHWAWKEYEK
jgi:hypothetical protein